MKFGKHQQQDYIMECSREFAEGNGDKRGDNKSFIHRQKLSEH